MADSKMTDSKPHKGKIASWWRQEFDIEHMKSLYADDPVPTDFGLGYIIRGTFMDHPRFGFSPGGHTSWVVKHDEATGEIETRNSRYTLVGETVLLRKAKEQDGKIQ